MGDEPVKPPPQPPLRAVLLAAGAVILLWFLHEIMDVLVLSVFAVVLAVVLSAPVTWLEQRRIPRWVASVIVFAAVAGVVVGLGWLVLPRLAKDASALGQNLPEYTNQVRNRISSFLDPYPQVQKNLPLEPEDAGDMIPPLPELARRVTRVSLSLAAVVAALLVLLAMVIYAVANPRPLLRLYLDLFPRRYRPRAARAFSRASVMLVGWIWSNVVVGTIEAILVGVVLGLFGIPAAIVWASLAFFAELVPKVGIYIMAVPPVLVALAIDPMQAVWVTLFFIAMDNVVGNFVAPRIRASAMKLHPVSVLFVMLAMAAAFGMLGALIATPIAAVIKAYFEEFYPPARRCASGEDALIEGMVRRDAPPQEGEETREQPARGHSNTQRPG